MTFTWDESKRKINLIKHGMDFVDAKDVFSGATFTFEDDRLYYGEKRLITVGLLRDVAVVIAHAERKDEIRIISMRKATKYEQKIYFQGFTD